MEDRDGAGCSSSFVPSSDSAVPSVSVSRSAQKESPWFGRGGMGGGVKASCRVAGGVTKSRPWSSTAAAGPSRESPIEPRLCSDLRNRFIPSGAKASISSMFSGLNVPWLPEFLLLKDALENEVVGLYTGDVTEWPSSWKNSIPNKLDAEASPDAKDAHDSLPPPLKRGLDGALS